MAGGRPKIMLSYLPENWKSKMITLAEQGASDVELRVTALDGICHETWIRLIAEEYEFSETVKRCGDKCRVWWEANGRCNLKDKDFNPTLWYMNMKNRFGWADKKEIKQEVSNKEGESFKVEDISGLDAKEVQSKLLDKINS